MVFIEECWCLLRGSCCTAELWTCSVCTEMGLSRVRLVTLVALTL